MRTLVIGGGIAGQAVLEAVRERDPHMELTLACAEPRLPYDRVALSTLLASGADPDTLALRPAGWYEDNRVEVLLNTRVEQLAARRTVRRSPRRRAASPSSSAAGCSASRPPAGWPRSAARRRSCT